MGGRETAARAARPSKTVFVAVFLSIKWKIDQDIFGRARRRRPLPSVYDLVALKIASFSLPSFPLFATAA